MYAISPLTCSVSQLDEWGLVRVLSEQVRSCEGFQVKYLQNYFKDKRKSFWFVLRIETDIRVIGKSCTQPYNCITLATKSPSYTQMECTVRKHPSQKKPPNSHFSRHTKYAMICTPWCMCYCVSTLMNQVANIDTIPISLPNCLICSIFPFFFHFSKINNALTLNPLDLQLFGPSLERGVIGMCKVLILLPKQMWNQAN